ncbi:MAG TPA: FixH family protein [Afifellaceae bacterium]|nr:FixH family protein [Afifellaceae bacterium]
MSANKILLLATGALALAALTSPGVAGSSEFEFHPVSSTVKNGAGSQIAVRLTHKPTGKPVSGAVLFRTRLDMGPDNMAAMTADHRAIPSDEAGVYRFIADLTMAGGWALRIMAKVQGEPETVQGTVVFQAKN